MEACWFIGFAKISSSQSRSAVLGPSPSTRSLDTFRIDRGYRCSLDWNVAKRFSDSKVMQPCPNLQQVWLHEQADLRIEGRILGFDECRRLDRLDAIQLWGPAFFSSVWEASVISLGTWTSSSMTLRTGIPVPDVGYTVRPDKVVSRVPMTGNHGEEEDSACHWPLAETSYTSFWGNGIFEVASSSMTFLSFLFESEFLFVSLCFNLCMFYVPDFPSMWRPNPAERWQHLPNDEYWCMILVILLKLLGLDNRSFFVGSCPKSSLQTPDLLGTLCGE